MNTAHSSSLSLTGVDSNGQLALCQSCDRCRSRKTKCDGNKPCASCMTKYMKKHKLETLEGVDPNDMGCIYSPAKRRGPVPGRTSRKSLSSFGSRSALDQQEQFNNGNMQNADWNVMPQQQQTNPFLAMTMGAAANSTMNQQGMPQGIVVPQNTGMPQNASMNNTMQQQPSQHIQSQYSTNNIEPKRMKMDMAPMTQQQQPKLPRTIMLHSHLLDKSDPEGSRLYSFYKLSIDELFRLPATPTDEEFLSRLGSHMIPGNQLAALSAARFAEIALGAVVHNEISLAMELCNAVVHCLRESVQESSGPVVYEIAKAYFLLGVFRAFRGDMERYFKYRRVCMGYLSKLDNDNDTAQLMAAISYLDSWAYMIYNADERQVPRSNQHQNRQLGSSNGYMNQTEAKYNVKCNPYSIATDPRNQNWIQGAPPVYVNNEAPLQARALDAIACAVRTCCDQANGRFAAIAKEAEQSAGNIPEETIVTPTSTAVMSNENELCSRNLVLSAYTLMQQYEGNGKGKHKHEGQHVLISAMDAFLENSDDDGSGGFTDSQVQSLLSVCNTVIENPFLLHHAGPTYHMITNAAVLLGHILNGMHALKSNNQFGQAEATMMEELMDTFIAIRKLLTIHRRKLPLRLRCHGIPRPNLGAQVGEQVVDLGETMLCACRGCQGFVLMACSPCVAAERARRATESMDFTIPKELEAVGLDELDRELDDLGAEFDMDDDALLGLVSGLLSN